MKDGINAVQKGHPKGIYLLFATEMWERFSYYGMRALFSLYMLKALLFDAQYSSSIYGSYTGLVYLTPLIGGYIADRYWGNRRSIIVGALLMAAGQFLLFMSGWFFKDVSLATTLMFSGLGLLIFGNGFFKPNISSMVGQLYAPGDSRKDSAYTIFYMGVNTGSFIAPLICGFFGDTGHPEDFKWGFLAACIGMLLGLVVFILFKDKYLKTPTGESIGVIPNSKDETKKTIEENAGKQSVKFPIKITAIWGAIWIVLFYVLFAVLDTDIFGAIIYSLAVVAPGYIISDPSLTKIERSRIWVIYIIAFFVIFFWAAFEQAGASLTYFAEAQIDRHIELFNWTIPTSYFQSVNALAIIVFAPLFVILWTKLGRKGKEPASPLKQSIGLFLLAIGYLVIAFGVKGLAPGIKVSMLWLVSLYVIHTFGELCLSPIGLSMVNKLAPLRFASLLMAIWYLSTATANKFAGTLSGYYPQPLIEVADVKAAAEKSTLKILPENFEKSVSEKDGIEVMPFDKIAFAEIKDKSLKEEIQRELEPKQMENPKTFLGYQISNLYDFFMLFVFMAGAASVVLFFLSRRLLKMMHGIR
ncbi:POT family proton-dependent oligopeptide transporter [Dysgonomonas sp. PFB1-18]|uniref:peptide MFS transporter n=1 Tax=unclassified Dysgonomonas TaxID=2630389 RepID=UPI002475C95A|nr:MULTISPECIES: peptide MFS transporter [unclassified Dysgonomonas]MDH6307250.1 POT family proton-dependent oligopeptide transporter [Dysgonomonas sp. PF1-14]MDH6337168.1 POT family proton-dependent oligopeptide transporter [Dysgonomonas sp. PF1-16]MDH6379092.1 POT family proton-dependent oligopeptide transporter [Dysgonomonas sp. PFB1-18]MDH6396271.1 POT family proton-dependent oligopeptide transporter [Dysgonomonas sp. PF1-23]